MLLSEAGKKSITGYGIIKSLCEFKCSSIKKNFRELPISECEDDYTKAMNYFVHALTAYKAITEAFF